MKENQRDRPDFSISYIILVMIAIWLVQRFLVGSAGVTQVEVPYSQFRQDLADGGIESATFRADSIIYTCCTVTDLEEKITELPPMQTTETSDENEGGFFAGVVEWFRPVELSESTTAIEDEVTQPVSLPVFETIMVDDPALIEDLIAANVTFSSEPSANNGFMMFFSWLLPFLPVLIIWYFLFQRMGQGADGIFSFGKSKAREITGEMMDITFASVGGVDEVEVELKEIIEFLKNAERFTQIGAKLPKGVLLVGPPGTGKTLLAKAIAGEANVPFFSISGSDFVEMFVGVGAARVRDLFEQAKSKAPSIVFIDEIDAIGGSRTSLNVGHANDEREQTLNQLLAEMDGFATNQGVVIMAATNRPEVLDKALLRPGRFDRQIQVPLPTESGRLEILEIHAKGVAFDTDVDLARLAQITSGFSGADLSNIVNEAALLAVRQGNTTVSMADFDLAIERVVAGLQRKMPLQVEVRRKVAYHEGGHALVAQLLPTTDQVHKVSIIPTAKGALGYTMQMPEEDQYLLSKQELQERMAVMLGGRAAELLVYHESSTGAANDLERVTELARRMVTEFGMTDALGPVRYTLGAGREYLSVENSLRQDLSPETRTQIDHEIRRLVDEAQDQALDLLETYKEALHEIAHRLQEHEVISGDEIASITLAFGHELDEEFSRTATLATVNLPQGESHEQPA